MELREANPDWFSRWLSSRIAMAWSDPRGQATGVHLLGGGVKPGADIFDVFVVSRNLVVAHPHSLCPILVLVPVLALARNHRCLWGYTPLRLIRAELREEKLELFPKCFERVSDYAVWPSWSGRKTCGN